MILPYFVDALYRTVKDGIGMISDGAKFWIGWAIVLLVIFLTICSVTTLVHNSGTPEQYCTTMLGERTSCDKK